jgi:hypothetical protein
VALIVACGHWVGAVHQCWAGRQLADDLRQSRLPGFGELEADLAITALLGLRMFL